MREDAGTSGNSARLEGFWKHLLEFVGRDFNGSLILHCSQGAVMKYEVHQIHRPRGGAVSLSGDPELSSP